MTQGKQNEPTNSEIGFDYSSLKAFSREMSDLADRYTQKAVDGQLDCRYEFEVDELECSSQQLFCLGLFMDMLSERPEIDWAETDGDGIVVCISPEYIRQENDEKLRKPSPKDVEVMCAKHILWLNDAGGEQADFSNCYLSELDLSDKNLTNMIFDGALLYGVHLDRADVGYSVFHGTRLYACTGVEIKAEETEFTGAKFIGGNYEDGRFCSSDFTDCSFCDVNLSGASMRYCCVDGTDFGDSNMFRTNMQDVMDNAEEWHDKMSGADITMQ